MATTDKVKIEIVSGVGGYSVYINDTRVAGPKPWGGGTCVKSWLVDKDSISQAVAANEGVKA